MFNSFFLRDFFFFSDYLLSRIESLPGVVDELNSKFTSYQQDYKGASPSVQSEVIIFRKCLSLKFTV